MHLYLLVTESGMWMLVEFCREVTDLQMPQVASVILPEMYKIFTQQNVSHFPHIFIRFTGKEVIYKVI